MDKIDELIEENKDLKKHLKIEEGLQALDNIKSIKMWNTDDNDEVHETPLSETCFGKDLEVLNKLLISYGEALKENESLKKEIKDLKEDNFNLEKDWHGAISSLNFVEEENTLLQCRIEKLENQKYLLTDKTLDLLKEEVEKTCFNYKVLNRALELAVKNRSLFSHGCPFKATKANGCESFGVVARNCKECYEKFLLNEAKNQIEFEEKIK